MLVIIGAAMMIIVSFTTSTALLATLVIPVGFLLVKDGVYHSYCADGRRVYYGDYQDDSPVFSMVAEPAC